MKSFTRDFYPIKRLQALGMARISSSEGEFGLWVFAGPGVQCVEARGQIDLKEETKMSSPSKSSQTMSRKGLFQDEETIRNPIGGVPMLSWHSRNESDCYP